MSVGEMNRIRAGVAAFAALTLAIVGLTGSPARADDGSPRHYLSNSAGCSDAGPGTDPAQPWCTFAPANAHTFAPGDQLLLERGSSWAEGLTMANSGTPEAPITIGAYGTGARPRITNSATRVGLTLTDVSHVRVRDLDIGSTTNGRSTMTYGIQANYTTLGHRDLVFEDLFLHDNRWLGLLVASKATHTVADTVLSGLVVRRVESTGNAHGFATTSYTSPTDMPNPGVPGKVGENVFRDVVLDRLHFHDDHNNNPGLLPAQVDSGCPDGLALQKASNVVIKNSVFDNEASCRTTSGTAALYLGAVRKVLITNNLFVNTPNTANPDMVAIDHESRTSQVEIRGNHFGNNYGGGIEYLAIHGANDFHTDDVTADNTFVGNGGGSLIPYPAGGSVGQLGNSIPVAARIENNLHSEPHAFVEAKIGGDTSRFRLAGNVGIADSADVHNAAAEFAAAGSDWGQQRLTTGWASLPWDEASQSYRAGDSRIDRATLTVGSAKAVARTWTAPRAGYLSIRGYALASGGPARVAVTLNGRTIAAHDLAAGAGWSSTVDDLRVRTGDVVAFVVKGSGETSWAPGLGYSAATRDTDPAGTWSFSVNGDAQGWTSDDPVSVRRGQLTIAAAGATTELRSPVRLDLDAARVGAIAIRALNRTRATTGTIDFVTTTGVRGQQAFTINAAQPKGLTEAITEYLVPLTDPNWQGRIASVTIVINGAVGDVVIDQIRLAPAPQHSWDFDAADGWTIDKDGSCPTPGAPVTGATPSVDNSAGTFIKHANINWTNTRMQSFRVPTGSLSQLDLWTYRTGAATGCLFLQVVELDATNQVARTLFTGAIPPGSVTTTGDWVSIFPGLSGLDPNRQYGVLISSPYQVPGTANYGIGYNDQGLYPEGGEFYSVDAGGIQRGPEASRKRSLRFRTFSGGTAEPAPPTTVPVTVARGVLSATTGYEPKIYSPTGLAIDAASSRYVRIRMNNPQNRQVAYLLFSTTDRAGFDQPNTGYPPRNEIGGRGVAFALVPGSDYVEYVLDMSHVPGWRGTVDQLMVQPLNRWNYRITSLSQTWTGSIGHIRVD